MWQERLKDRRWSNSRQSLEQRTWANRLGQDVRRGGLSTNEPRRLQPEEFPALQSNRYVSIQPEKIVERLQVKLVSLAAARLGQKTHDLRLADLIGDRLSRIRSKERRFRMGRV